MFWREEKQPESEFRVPDDIYDLVFRLRGEYLDVDHAYALSQALRDNLSDETCACIGVHGVRMASSGNGWNCPDAPDAEIPLSRRARLVIRVHRDQADEVASISQRRLSLGRQSIEVGVSSVRPLSSIGTLFARAVYCERGISEDDFLQQAADELKEMDIDVSRMLCGKAGEIRIANGSLFTRALLVTDLKPAESVRLQQLGIGGERMLGCGLFVPHKEIDAVYEAQEKS